MTAKDLAHNAGLFVIQEVYVIVLHNMCGNCRGEPYSGVRALFNGDLQSAGGFEDRSEWIVFSSRIAVFLGESALKNEDHPLFRACDNAIEALTTDERVSLEALSKNLKRPAFGRP